MKNERSTIFFTCLVLFTASLVTANEDPTTERKIIDEEIRNSSSDLGPEDFLDTQQPKDTLPISIPGSYEDEPTKEPLLKEILKDAKQNVTDESSNLRQSRNSPLDELSEDKFTDIQPISALSPSGQQQSCSCETEALMFGFKYESKIIAYTIVCETKRLFHYLLTACYNLKIELPLDLLFDEKEQGKIPTSLSDLLSDGNLLTIIEDAIARLEKLLENPENLKILPDIINMYIPLPEIQGTLNRLKIAIEKFINHVQGLLESMGPNKDINAFIDILKRLIEEIFDAKQGALNLLNGNLPASVESIVKILWRAISLIGSLFHKVPIQDFFYQIFTNLKEFLDSIFEYCNGHHTSGFLQAIITAVQTFVSIFLKIFLPDISHKIPWINWDHGNSPMPMTRTTPLPSSPSTPGFECNCPKTNDDLPGFFSLPPSDMSPMDTEAETSAPKPIIVPHSETLSDLFSNLMGSPKPNDFPLSLFATPLPPRYGSPVQPQSFLNLPSRTILDSPPSTESSSEMFPSNTPNKLFELFFHPINTTGTASRPGSSSTTPSPVDIGVPSSSSNTQPNGKIMNFFKFPLFPTRTSQTSTSAPQFESSFTETTPVTLSVNSDNPQSMSSILPEGYIPLLPPLPSGIPQSNPYSAQSDLTPSADKPSLNNMFPHLAPNVQRDGNVPRLPQFLVRPSKKPSQSGSSGYPSQNSLSSFAMLPEGEDCDETSQPLTSSCQTQSEPGNSKPHRPHSSQAYHNFLKNVDSFYKNRYPDRQQSSPALASPSNSNVFAKILDLYRSNTSPSISSLMNSGICGTWAFPITRSNLNRILKDIAPSQTRFQLAKNEIECQLGNVALSPSDIIVIFLNDDIGLIGRVTNTPGPINFNVHKLKPITVDAPKGVKIWHLRSEDFYNATCRKLLESLSQGY